MNVFELNYAIKNLQDKAEKGEVDPEALKDTLESLDLARDQKLDSVANWIEENNAKIDWLDLKLKQLREAKTHYKNQNDSLINYLTQALDDSGYKELQTKNHIIGWGRKSTRVEVPDVNKIPIDYVKRTEKITADKTKLKEDLKAGKEITGAELITSRKVVIK